MGAGQAKEAEVLVHAHPSALDDIRLTYFNLPGLGEAVRLALLLAHLLEVRRQAHRVLRVELPQAADALVLAARINTHSVTPPSPPHTPFRRPHTPFRSPRTPISVLSA
jgi:hypothetical protein